MEKVITDVPANLRIERLNEVQEAAATEYHFLSRGDMAPHLLLVCLRIERFHSVV